MGQVTLSEKHGVNPSLVQCYLCLEAKSLALFGRLPNDAKAPHQAVHDQEPCDNCKAIVQQGVILISIRDGEKPPTDGGMANPHRTGGWVALRDAAIRRIFDPATAATLLTRRAGFVEDSAWDQLGLPRGAMDGVPGNMQEFHAQQGNPMVPENQPEIPHVPGFYFVACEGGQQAIVELRDESDVGNGLVAYMFGDDVAYDPSRFHGYQGPIRRRRAGTKTTDYDAADVLSFVYDCMAREPCPPWLASFERDHKSGEIVVTDPGGNDWIITAKQAT